MTTEQLWDYLFAKKVARVHPLDRDFIWVNPKDFAKVSRFFQEERNILHQGKAYRSRAWWRHIHAIEKGEYLFIHFDHGNHQRFLLLGVAHILRDVIPYALLCLIKGKRFGFYFVMPG